MLDADGKIITEEKTGAKRVFKSSDDKNSLSSNIVVSLCPDGGHGIWIGTFLGGLCHFDGQRFTRFKGDKTSAPAAGADNVWSVAQSQDGSLWVGSLGQGLAMRDSKTSQWKQWGQEDGLPSDYVTKVTPMNGNMVAEVIRQKKKITATQTINQIHKNVMTVGIPLFDNSGDLKYAVCFNTVSMEQINAIQQNYRHLQDSLQHYSQEIAELRTRATSTSLLFKSASMQRLWTLMQNTANTKANILITGETGVGKSAIAKAIHAMSNRADGPFIEVNCAVLHENLIESELFGYEKGAFTGASSSGKIGKIELANHGTLFLDEIGELPPHIQSKLLQLIQEKTIERLSGTKKIELDFRLIFATNRNLEEEVQRGLFRSDLFYRLNVIRIHIPPLRKRVEDILPLAHQFLARFCGEYGKSLNFSPRFLAFLGCSTLSGSLGCLLLHPDGSILYLGDDSHRYPYLYGYRYLFAIDIRSGLI